MNKLGISSEQVMNKSLTTHEQVTKWWFPTAVRIMLSQPPAGDWLAGAWAELGNILQKLIGAFVSVQNSF